MLSFTCTAYTSDLSELCEYLAVLEKSREQNWVTDRQYQLLKTAILHDIKTGTSTLTTRKISDDPLGTWRKGVNNNRRLKTPPQVKDLVNIAIIPFANTSDRPNNVVDEAYNEVAGIFKEHGYFTIPRRNVDEYLVRNRIQSSQHLLDDDLAMMAKALDVRHIITGEIKQLRANKRFSLGGALLSVFCYGITTYSTVEIKSAIFDRNLQKKIWKNDVKKTIRDRFLSIFSSLAAVQNLAFKSATKLLYKSFFEKRLKIYKANPLDGATARSGGSLPLRGRTQLDRPGR